LIGRNRKAYRENKKRRKWQEALKHGQAVGMKNEYGNTDLTAYNADMVCKKRMKTEDIRY